MANYSYLYSSQNFGPPNPDDDQVIAAGRYFIPAFWIASCSLDDLYSYVDEDDWNVPYVSLPVRKALSQFEANKKFLEIVSPDIEKYYCEWTGLLTDLGNVQLKLDPSEVIFMMNEDDSSFRDAITFFSEINDATISGLLSNSCLPNILDVNEPKKLIEYAIVLDQVTELTAADYLLGIRD